MVFVFNLYIINYAQAFQTEISNSLRPFRSIKYGNNAIQSESVKVFSMNSNDNMSPERGLKGFYARPSRAIEKGG